MRKTITVVGAVVDTKELKMFLKDRSTVVLPRSHHEVADIIQKLIPAITANQPVTIEYSAETNEYAAVEEQTGGFVKFFRTAKSKFRTLLGLDSADLKVEEKCPEKLEKTQLVVAEIMSTAIPVTHEDKPIEEHEDVTIVAQVGGVVIPCVEKISSQFKVAKATGNGKGVEEFFRRMASHAEDRRHTVDELFRFLEKGNLPVTQDGCFLGFKLLYRVDTPDGDYDGYRDPHTQRVTQNVGCIVRMPIELVDADRRVECSSGIHVARWDYLRTFSGNTVALVKIAPEDVIAVPERDASKIRVMRYEVVHVFEDKFFRDIKHCSSGILDNPEISAIINDVVAGNYPAMKWDVCITQHQGRGIKVTPLAQSAAPAVVNKVIALPAIDPNKQALAYEEDSSVEFSPEQVQEIADTVVQVKTESTAVKLFNEAQTSEKAWEELLKLKSQKKYSWHRLGIDPEQAAALSAKYAPKSVPPKKQDKEEPMKKGNTQTIYAELAKGIDARSIADGNHDALIKEIEARRRAGKKGWLALGIDADIAKAMQDRIKVIYS